MLIIERGQERQKNWAIAPQSRNTLQKARFSGATYSYCGWFFGRIARSSANSVVHYEDGRRAV
jgi:hypothetical protein